MARPQENLSRCGEGVPFFKSGDFLSATLKIALSHEIRQAKLSEDSIVNVAKPAEVQRLMKSAIPSDSPTPIQDVLESSQEIFSYRATMDHPRWFGLIPSPVSSISMIAELLASTYNANSAAWYISSGPSTIELSLIRWLAHKVGFPVTTAGGTFLSGGSIANFSAIVLARDTKLPNFEDRAIAVAYCSDETHASISKAMRILGFREDQLRKIPSDRNFRVDVDVLRRAIVQDKAQNKKPFLVIGNLGTTNTGSVDPISQLSDISEQHNLWLHIDGAYGASIVLSRSYTYLAEGLGRADSLAWDAHKWLFMTCGCGMLLVKDRKDLVQSFNTTADYLSETMDEAETNPSFLNLGIEMSRPARAMRLWFTLKVLGMERVGSWIDHGVFLAKTAEKELRSMSGWEILSSEGMGIICFRFIPDFVVGDESKLDALQKEISKAAEDKHIAAMLTTKVRGKTAIRMCSISPALRLENMQLIVRELNKTAIELAKLHTNVRHREKRHREHWIVA